MKLLLVLKLKERPPIPTEKFLEMIVKEWETALQFRKEGKADVNCSWLLQWASSLAL